MAQRKVKKQQNRQRKEFYPYFLIVFSQPLLVAFTTAPNKPQGITALYDNTLETNL